MKHTIKLDAIKSIVIEPKGGKVQVSLCTAGIAAITQPIGIHEAQAIALALFDTAKQMEVKGQAA